MPRAPKDVPDSLRPYISNGVELEWGNHDKEAKSNCPFCGRDEKFSVNIDSGQFRCLVCAEGTTKGGGNAYTFIRHLHAESMRTTQLEQYVDLVNNRKFLSADSLRAWGCCRSLTTGNWIMPGYGPTGEVCQLYSYVRTNGRMLMMPTATLGHQMFGLTLPLADTVWITEGPWDGVALWEIMGLTGFTTEGLAPSSNGNSLLHSTSIISVSSTGAVGDPFLKYVPMLAGKTVNLCFHNDHPVKNEKTGELCDPSGWSATKRILMLLDCDTPPKKINFIKWGSNDLGWEGVNLDLKHGYDVRDILTELPKQGMLPRQARIEALGNLFKLVEEIPVHWINEAKDHKDKEQKHELVPKTCHSYEKLSGAWRHALNWTEGLDHAFPIMLACTTSTMMLGDQLWFRVLGPPGCGKTTLAEAISVCKKHVKSVSTLKGMYSGAIDESGEDFSLINAAASKTLVVKDGDPLLQQPNLGQILSELRDIYDTVGRPSYRNKAKTREYMHKRMTLLLCGTASLRHLDDSELGERTLDCVVMKKIDDDLEDEVLNRIAHRSATSLQVEVNGKADTHYEGSMLKAMQLTGGYVEYLRDKATELIADLTISDEVKYQCTRLGKFVAHLRARPSKKQKETVQREFASRLTSQFVRLAGCLAIVLNKNTVDNDIMVRVRRVAMDTSDGATFKIVDYLRLNPDGATLLSVASMITQSTDDTVRLLQFLIHIEVVETFALEGVARGTRIRYRLTPRMVRMWQAVHAMV